MKKTRKLRQMCLQSQRFNEVDYAIYKKEIGAIEIHGMEEYFEDMVNSSLILDNNSNSTVAYLLGITDDPPDGSVKYKGGTNPD